VTARQVWQAGAQEANAVVIDIAGPVPFAVDGARLAALADGRPAPLPHNDPDVQALAGAALGGEPLIAGFALLPGSDGSDLTIQVMLAHGYGPADARAQAAIQRAVERIVAGGALLGEHRYHGYQQARRVQGRQHGVLAAAAGGVRVQGGRHAGIGRPIFNHAFTLPGLAWLPGQP